MPRVAPEERAEGGFELRPMGVSVVRWLNTWALPAVGHVTLATSFHPSGLSFFIGKIRETVEEERDFKDVMYVKYRTKGLGFRKHIQ